MLKYVSRQNYTIPGKSTITINFVDPMNYYRVVNSGNVTIYGGTVTMPTRKLYDFKVPAYNAKMYAEENVRKQLYLYNDGTEEATVLVYAFRSQFEPTVLALCDAIFNDTENTVSVEINGFSEPLPTGNNKVGKVDVASMPTELNTTITNIANILNSLTGFYINDLYFKSGTAIPDATTYEAGNGKMISELVFISNDGTEDLSIVIVGSSGSPLTLKPGEVLNNAKCFSTLIHVSGNNVPFRLAYNTVTLIGV